MSYDIDIYDNRGPCPTCDRDFDEEVVSLNYTSNIRPMLDFVGITFQDLAELEGDALKEKLELLCKRLHDPNYQDGLERLQPKNGWGDLSGLKTLVTSMYDTAQAMRYPCMDLDD